MDYKYDLEMASRRLTRQAYREFLEEVKEEVDARLDALDDDEAMENDTPPEDQ